MAKPVEIRIEYTRLDGLQPAERNPKDHDIGAIVQSLVRFGFVSPGIRNEATGRTLVGHGRAEALVLMMREGYDLPARLGLDGDGMWLVPEVRGVSFESDEDAEAYLVSDNMLTTLGGWNDPVLLDSLQVLAASGKEGLAGTGYDNEDLDVLAERLGHFDVDPVDPPGLASGDRSVLQQVTYTVHVDQLAVLNDAVAAALDDGHGVSEVNKNKNGNAVAAICGAYLAARA